MVIDIINVLRVAVVQAKDHPPVGTYRNRPKALPVTLKRVQLKSRYIHIGNDESCVKPYQNVAHLFNVLSLDAARVVVIIKTFKSLVANRPNHRIS